jgi:hypothetical protein
MQISRSDAESARADITRITVVAHGTRTAALNVAVVVCVASNIIGLLCVTRSRKLQKSSFGCRPRTSKISMSCCVIRE